MRALLLLTSLLAAGCLKQPDIFAPPEQRRPLVINGKAGLSHFIHMNAPEAPDHFVADIVPQLHDNHFRWTLQKPALQFRLPLTRGMKFRAALYVPEVTFEQTGPVTIQIFIGAQLLETLRVDKPGERIVEKDVPEEWLTTERPVTVRFEIDKLWVSPADGTRRGFLLISVGFVQ